MFFSAYKAATFERKIRVVEVVDVVVKPNVDVGAASRTASARLDGLKQSPIMNCFSSSFLF